ncbi:hypothetical protein JCM16303_001160 [Sporobolomyces ruberrimus]
MSQDTAAQLSECAPTLQLSDPTTASNSPTTSSSLTSSPSKSTSFDEPTTSLDSAEVPQKRSGKPRKPRIPLTGPPEEILSKNRIAASPNAGANWHRFYQNHSAVPFFKDRHWINREWDMESKLGGKGKGKAILETGCGTGALIYPLLELYPEAKYVGFDFAAKAVELTKAHAAHDSSKVHIFQHDLTEPSTAPSLAERLADVPQEFGPPVDQFDIVSHIFVLSALAPRNHAAAVKTLIGLLAPGGTLLFRDYALHDEAQLRFHALPSASYATVPALLSAQTDSPASTEPENAPHDKPGDAAGSESNRPWYKRGDQTMTYFFTSEEVQDLVDQACRDLGRKVEGSVAIVERKLENRAQEWECTRRFVHGSWTRTE